MGAWGPALFSDDLACDVRGDYRQQLEDGVDNEHALAVTLERYRGSLADIEDGPVVVLALAVAASRLGRLTAELRDQAVALIDAGRGLERWEDDPKLLQRRKAALAKARAQLVGEQPVRKKVRPPARNETSLVPGDVLAFEAGERDFRAVRVVRIDECKEWRAPTVQLLDWSGDHLPTEGEIRDAPDSPPRPKLPGTPSNPLYRTHSTHLGTRRRDYPSQGFVKIGTIESRPGDSDRSAGGVGGWNTLAAHLRAIAAAELRPPMTRQRLVELLELDGTSEATAAAVELRADADFTYYDVKTQPAEHLATVYRRRSEHARRTGLDARGLDAAVERFEATDEVGDLARARRRTELLRLLHPGRRACPRVHFGSGGCPHMTSDRARREHGVVGPRLRRAPAYVSWRLASSGVASELDARLGDTRGAVRAALRSVRPRGAVTCTDGFLVGLLVGVLVGFDA